MGAMIFSAPGGGGGLWSECSFCSNVDTSEWIFCIDEERPAQPSKGKKLQRKRRAKDVASDVWTEGSVLQRMEELTKELFRLHDLNGNGVLEEVELVRLNEKIAILHHGKDTDTQEVRSKYKELFREKLDPHGRPVPYEKFRTYAQEVLNGLDTDLEAQEMILEQFVAEAQSGRQAINCPSVISESDLPSLLDLEPAGLGRNDSRALELDAVVGPPQLLHSSIAEEGSRRGAPASKLPFHDQASHTSPASPAEGSLETVERHLSREHGFLHGPVPLLPAGIAPPQTVDSPVLMPTVRGFSGDKLTFGLEPRSLRRADSDSVILDQSLQIRSVTFSPQKPAGRSSNAST